jgi:hypothetical protein
LEIEMKNSKAGRNSGSASRTNSAVADPDSSPDLTNEFLLDTYSSNSNSRRVLTKDIE